MNFLIYSNGSSNPSPGNGPPNQMHLLHLQQNHPSHAAAPPPVQQAYMYPPPPPPASLAPQAQLVTPPGTTQSYTDLSNTVYPSSQDKAQTARWSSQQFHSHLRPVSMLPLPPPLPPGTMPPSQALPNPFLHLPSFPFSFPARSLEPPGMPLPPPPPRPSSLLVAETACDKPEAAKHVCESVSLNGIPLEHERPVVEDAGYPKESSIHCDGSSPPHEKAEFGSSSCSDPDIEMEDDITMHENENHPSQALNCGFDQVPGVYLNTEQLHPQRISAQTNSITSIAMNSQTVLPGSKSYAQIHQDTDDGSRQASSSPYSGIAKIVPECELGDMYDLFVDSFEPASVKLDCAPEHEPVNDSSAVLKESVSSNRPLNVEENDQGVDKQTLCESDMTARVSVSSNIPPDVEENTTGNDIEAMVSGDKDEFGESAENEREGNSHETGTPISHNEDPKASNNVHNMSKKPRGDPKEKESSRSMKLFKVALTKFVKDLLKPSWRQGDMSKEAFKTIVKRAVDKVSNSMEGRRIPKSKAKIDRYIDTSQHKLTKLVMGYVDKYVKA